MSLNWDLTECSIDSKILWDDENSGITESMIYSCMIVGIGQITMKNVDEFWHRISMYQSIAGPLLVSANEDGKVVPKKMTSDNVRNYIGLRTNADTLSKTKFMSKIYSIHCNQVGKVNISELV